MNCQFCLLLGSFNPRVNDDDNMKLRRNYRQEMFSIIFSYFRIRFRNLHLILLLRNFPYHVHMLISYVRIQVQNYGNEENNDKISQNYKSGQKS